MRKDLERTARKLREKNEGWEGPFLPGVLLRDSCCEEG